MSMSRKREFQVTTVNVPREYDPDVYIFEKVIGMIEKCPNCYASSTLSVDYYRSNIYPAWYETFPQFIRRIFRHKLTHVMECSCHKCGAQYRITFYTNKNCINIYNECNNLLRHSNEKAEAACKECANNDSDENNLGSSRWIFNLRIGG